MLSIFSGEMFQCPESQHCTDWDYECESSSVLRLPAASSGQPGLGRKMRVISAQRQCVVMSCDNQGPRHLLQPPHHQHHPLHYTASCSPGERSLALVFYNTHITLVAL